MRLFFLLNFRHDNFIGSPYHVPFPIEEDGLVSLSCGTFREGRKAAVWELEGRGLDRGYQL